MNDKDLEKITLLATTIAIELTKCKTPQEINELKYIVFQIYSTINTISSLKR